MSASTDLLPKFAPQNTNDHQLVVKRRPKVREELSGRELTHLRQDDALVLADYVWTSTPTTFRSGELSAVDANDSPVSWPSRSNILNLK